MLLPLHSCLTSVLWTFAAALTGTPDQPAHDRARADPDFAREACTGVHIVSRW